jgi:hypothetical protein
MDVVSIVNGNVWGKLGLCHYKYRIFEECHYYSSNRGGAITISHLFE